MAILVVAMAGCAPLNDPTLGEFDGTLSIQGGSNSGSGFHIADTITVSARSAGGYTIETGNGCVFAATHGASTADMLLSDVTAGQMCSLFGDTYTVQINAFFSVIPSVDPEPAQSTIRLFSTSTGDSMTMTFTGRRHQRDM